MGGGKAAGKEAPPQDKKAAAAKFQKMVQQSKQNTAAIAKVDKQSDQAIAKAEKNPSDDIKKGLALAKPAQAAIDFIFAKDKKDTAEIVGRWKQEMGKGNFQGAMQIYQELQGYHQYIKKFIDEALEAFKQGWKDPKQFQEVIQMAAKQGFKPPKAEAEAPAAAPAEKQPKQAQQAQAGQKPQQAQQQAQQKPQ